MEAAEERGDVLGGRVAVQDVVGKPLEGVVVDDRQDAERPVLQLVGGDEAGAVGEGPVEVFGPVPPRRFFPGLDPIRDRGRRDEHAVVTPEGPTGGAVGQAVLDDQANGRVAHPAGVVTTGCGEVGGVGVEVLAAAGTVMLGSEDDEIAGPAGERVAEVVESSADEPVAVGTLATTRARPPAVVAASGY